MNEQHSARPTETHKHTPGPWRVDPTHRLCIESAANGNIGLVNIARASEADARLIAAAPDLLAACKAIAAAPYGIALGDLQRLQSALDKAEGRS